jgi:deoxyribose-phosphate aldolase
MNMTKEMNMIDNAMKADHVMSAGDIARLIDHTLLRPDAVRQQIVDLCKETEKYDFYSVCVNPIWVKVCADILKGGRGKVCTVIGFPLGASCRATKMCEAETAVRDGADELDMVINVGALKSGDHETVKEDIKGIVAIAGKGINVKVIIETALLTDDEKVTAAKFVQECGASFVKTSTGFAKSGATIEDVALLRRTVGPGFGVKASGGIKDTATAMAMIRAGATRLGTSSGIAILAGNAGNDPY